MEIRLLSFEDLPARVDCMNNPKVYGNMHFEVPVRLNNTQRWFEKNQTQDNRSDVTFLIDDRIVAFGGITSIDRSVGKGELYIFVKPDIQTKGLGTQATGLLCKYGFEKLGLNKIYLETNEDNFIAQRVYEKCGFKLEGRLRYEYRNNNGELKDRLYFGLLKEEFANE